jgi:putative acetyltransferase
MMNVRPVQLEDVSSAVALVRDVLTEFGLEFGTGSEKDAQLAGLPASYRDFGGEFFVAIDAGNIIGTAGIFPLEPGVFELRKMYLHPSARGLGAGQELFDACLDFCRGQNAKSIVLDTRDDMRAAIAFYERRGFVRDDTQIRGARCSRGYRLDL